ncbi:unnamed protein product [Heligmosomoides polygyrus]|uniref:Uncharacterized protein n=1 Tax=Heligmosomoides polygyrus TaxID=6339 RepID=A0A183G3P2_HELPZ|nr:unnamed protein product [Heligmosomoides polygyrus]
MMTLKTLSDARNALRCSPVNVVPDAAPESVDDVGDVGDGLSVTGRSVGDASPKYSIGLGLWLTFPATVLI